MKTEEIRKLLEQNKLIIGREETKKGLGNGNIKTVLLASNAPEMEASAMKDYAELSGANVVELEANNEDLGTICRKPFNISFLGIKT